MAEASGGQAIDLAIDNDILIKAALYGLAGMFWLDGGSSIGVLGAAPYVVPTYVERFAGAEGKDVALAAANKAFEVAQLLEPTDDEVQVAAELEAIAQRRGLGFDVGESQLVAIVLARAIPVLETGDKRAIKAIESLLEDVPALEGLCGRVRSLEQVVREAADKDGAEETIAKAVCSRPSVDKTLSICFRCFTDPPAGHRLDPEGLASYIAALRKEAPRVLAT